MSATEQATKKEPDHDHGEDHTGDDSHDEHSRHHHHHHGNPFVTSAQATFHCLSGCVIGEVAGLMIGVTLGLSVIATMALATALAYISGFTLGLIPVMRNQRKTLVEAFKLIWIGEAISIGVMEIAMNAADYYAGGMTADSVFTSVFWVGVGAAVIAGFLAAWPVNWWLLERDLKHCH